MLIISTRGDQKVNGDKRVPILSQEDINLLASTHGIDIEKVIILDDDSRAPMISANIADDFNIKIYDWIDNI
jgi:glutaredoxin 2